jgi:hypothetical protein
VRIGCPPSAISSPSLHPAISPLHASSPVKSDGICTRVHPGSSRCPRQKKGGKYYVLEVFFNIYAMSSAADCFCFRRSTHCTIPLRWRRNKSMVCISNKEETTARSTRNCLKTLSAKTKRLVDFCTVQGMCLYSANHSASDEHYHRSNRRHSCPEIHPV